MPTSLGQLTAEIQRMNPWWRDPRGWAARDPDLRSAADSGLDYRPGALADLERGGLYLLRGPRRVGKTVTVKQVIQDLLARGVAPLAIVRLAADGWEARNLRTVIQNAPLAPLPRGRGAVVVHRRGHRRVRGLGCGGQVAARQPSRVR